MTIEERTKIALNVINCTLAIDDLPLEILNRLSTLYVLLDEDAEAEETAIAKEEAVQIMQCAVTVLA